MIKRRTFIASAAAAAAAASLPRHSFGAAPAQPLGIKLFDTHAHFYTYEPEKYFFDGAGSRYGKERMIAKAKANPMNAEAVFKFWDAIGVEAGTGVQYNSTYGTDNSYLLDVCRAHPKRAIPVVILGPTDPKTPELLAKWAREERLAAIRWTGTARGGAPIPYFSAESEPAWQVCNDLGLSVVLMPLAGGGEVLKQVMQRRRQVSEREDRDGSHRLPAPGTAAGDLRSHAGALRAGEAQERLLQADELPGLGDGSRRQDGQQADGGAEALRGAHGQDLRCRPPDAGARTTATSKSTMCSTRRT